jgi:hypothetical protein
MDGPGMVHAIVIERHDPWTTGKGTQFERAHGRATPRLTSQKPTSGHQPDDAAALAAE